MEEPNKIIEPLLKSGAEFGKTYLELIRLKTVRQVSDLSATLLTQSILVLIATISIVSLNIAIALWIGDMLGKNYWGFLVVAGFYGSVVIILLLIKAQLKIKVQNSFIKKMLN